jgi:uncharacterized protein (TIGR00297 family)
VTAGAAILGIALNLTLAAAALARRSLTPAGAAAGVAVGMSLYWAGGLPAWTLLALFFVSSTLLSRVGRAGKEEVEVLTGKGDRRDALQVVANGGPAAFMALLWRLAAEPAFLVGTACALAAANADTWASELGLLSRRQPVSLLGLRPVARGQSGGVTLVGLVASLGGSLLIAFAFALFRSTRELLGGRTPLAVAIVAGCGLAGSIVDSLLGASLQGRYRAAEGGAYTERSRARYGALNTLFGGIRGVSNDTVNLLSGLIVSGAAVLVATIAA